MKDKELHLEGDELVRLAREADCRKIVGNL